jgi:hypothetical protein
LVLSVGGGDPSLVAAIECDLVHSGFFLVLGVHPAAAADTAASPSKSSRGSWLWGRGSGRSSAGGPGSVNAGSRVVTVGEADISAALAVWRIVPVMR